MIESLDIRTLERAYQAGKLRPEAVLDEIRTRIDRYPDPAVWTDRFPWSLLDQQLAAARQRLASGRPQPLLGIPFAIKDNIDFAGRATTAACPAFAYTPAKSATVVQQLCDAGAIAIGKTNLDQFATGLVGTRSPYGAVRNPFNEKYISGGSSSGSAVAVSAGMVSFSLGTDTAGSGRIPAALNNIVGLKPTRGLISAAGVVPACQSLDCVSIFSLNCADAEMLFNLLEQFDSSDPYSRHRSELPIAPIIPARGFRFGIPAGEGLRFFHDEPARIAFAASVARVEALGGTKVEFDFTPFAKVASLLYAGPWVAERRLIAEELLHEHPAAVLPVIRTILSRAPQMTAAETFTALHELQTLRQQTLPSWEAMDFMLVPSAGFSPTAAQVQEDPIGPNTQLGYYTNFVNLLDLSALAVPGGFGKEGVPLGVTMIGRAGQELSLLSIGDRLHQALKIGPGLARYPLIETEIDMTLHSGRARLAVVGAHLSGMPLNTQLTERHATLVRAARTAPVYRLYALPGTVAPKPGLIRAADGASIELEIWEMSLEAFGSFVAAIPAPLGVGVIQLEDGTSVQGFLCESIALTGATDITSFGGWRAYMKSK